MRVDVFQFDFIVCHFYVFAFAFVGAIVLLFLVCVCCASLLRVVLFVPSHFSFGASLLDLTCCNFVWNRAGCDRST